MQATTRASDATPRRILISGSSGLIGRRIVAERRAAGDTVVRLVREGPSADAILWKPGAGTLDPRTVSGFDAVIHLAGEPLAGRWTAAKKRRIRESRVEGTAELAAALTAAEQPPAVFLCASGINFYGNRGDTVVDESAPLGRGFLAEVCQAWEDATAPLAHVSRVVKLRIGMVLAGDGGALAAMLPIFRLGLGGPVGGGRGYVSWVSIDDLVRAFEHVIQSSQLNGPVNVVTPEPVTGRALTAAIGAALGRPAVLPVPAWLARLLLGELAEDTVLGSVRAIPKRLTEDGFEFRDLPLAKALAGCGLKTK